MAPELTLWQKVKREAKHYYDGTRLLVMEIRTSSGLLKRVLYGYSLTRRERTQLMRTTTDLLRLVPFSVFVVVPFMELLLPFALRLFPGMLPSTYTSELEQQERLKRNLNARLEMASFLQDMLENIARDNAESPSKATSPSSASGSSGPSSADGNKAGSAGSSSDEASIPRVGDIMEIIAAARAGRHVETDQVLQLAKLFKDRVTLNNMPRAQLVQLCK